MNVLPAGLADGPDDERSLQVGIRPEHVVIDGTSSLRATVALVEQLGHEVLVYCQVGDTRIVVRGAAGGDAVARVGDEVGLRLPAEHRHHFDPTTGRRVDR
jgi:ABC-type sugar transport system ATPase subunit